MIEVTNTMEEVKRVALAMMLVACGKSAPNGGAPGSASPGMVVAAAPLDAAASAPIVSSDAALDPRDVVPPLLDMRTVAMTNGKPVKFNGIEVRIDGEKIIATEGTTQSVDLVFGSEGFAEVRLHGNGFVVTKTAGGLTLAHTGDARPPEECSYRLQTSMAERHIAVPEPLGETIENNIMSVRSGGWIAKCAIHSHRQWFVSASGREREVDAKDITKPAAHKPIAGALLPVWTEPTGPQIKFDGDGTKSLGGVSLRYRDRDHNVAHPHYEIVATLGGKTETADVSTTGRDAEFRVFGRGFVVSFPGGTVLVTQVTPVKTTCSETMQALVTRLGIDDTKDDEIVGSILDAGFEVRAHSGWTISCGSVTGRISMQPSAPYKVIP